LAISPDSPIALAELGYGYAVTGRRAEALKVFDRSNQIAKQKYVSPSYMAVVLTGLGDKEHAIESLQKAYEDRSFASVVSFQVNPIGDPLRTDPRFQDLRRRMNLQP
jgi:tetratricopeptide (TPR) repeat protein